MILLLKGVYFLLSVSSAGDMYDYPQRQAAWIIWALVSNIIIHLIFSVSFAPTITVAFRLFARTRLEDTRCA